MVVREESSGVHRKHLKLIFWDHECLQNSTTLTICFYIKCIKLTFWPEDGPTVVSKAEVVCTLGKNWCGEVSLRIMTTKGIHCLWTMNSHTILGNLSICLNSFVQACSCKGNCWSSLLWMIKQTDAQLDVWMNGPCKTRMQYLTICSIVFKGYISNMQLLFCCSAGSLQCCTLKTT